jgi:hypothetical protein
MTNATSTQAPELTPAEYLAKFQAVHDRQRRARVATQQARAIAGDIWTAAFSILDGLDGLDGDTAGRIAQAAADAVESAWLTEHNNPPRFPIGTQYTDRNGRECTVTDYLLTRDTAGRIVKRRYVIARRSFFGQLITDGDVCETTIARRLADA